MTEEKRAHLQALLAHNRKHLSKNSEKCFRMASHTKGVLKSAVNMNKGQCTGHGKATPLKEILGNAEKIARSTDYTIKTDLKISHDGDWDDVKRLTIKIHFQREEKGQLPINFKLETFDRLNSPKPGYFRVTLPNKDAIINGETRQFLVLIPVDKKTVIMPLYYRFLEEELDNTNKSGKLKCKGRVRCNLCSATAEIRSYNRRNGSIWIRVQH